MVEYGRPWITYDAIKWLDCFLNQTMRAFEWGSGGSTIFISQRVKHLISIEHDKKWYQLVLQSIEKNKIFNCEYLLVEPEQITPGQWDFFLLLLTRTFGIGVKSNKTFFLSVSTITFGIGVETDKTFFFDNFSNSQNYVSNIPELSLLNFERYVKNRTVSR